MLLTILLTTAMGAGDLKEILAKDIVTVDAQGGMTASTLEMCKSGSSSKQFRITAEAAPDTGISRDHFVFLYGTLTTKLLGDQDCKEIDQVIGEVDGEFKIAMNATGIQFSVSAGGKTERFTETWEDLDK